MSFFSELRRRNVFKVSAAYAIVGWLLAQLAEFATETFGAPDWVLQIFVIFLVLGLPVALLLAWAYELTPEGLKPASAVDASDRVTEPTGHRFNYFIVGVLALAVGFLAIDRFLLEPNSNAIEDINSATTGVSEIQESTARTILQRPPVRRFLQLLGSTAPMGNTGLDAFIALSPDGRRLAYTANLDGTTRLYVRALDQLEARAMPNTEGARNPFFSPDGEWLAFYTDDTDQALKRIAFRGGPAQALVDSPGSPGGYWSDDGFLVMPRTVDGSRSLYRMPAAGGMAEPISSPAPDEGHVWPSPLPGGKALLFVIRPGVGGSGAIRDGSIAVLSLESGEHRVLIEAAQRPVYVPTGHIIFARSGALWAVPFDAERIEVTGPEVPVISGVQQNDQIGGAAFAVSQDGLLLYVPGDDSRGAIVGASKELVWVDRQGREESLSIQPGTYWHPRLSPDGHRLGITVGPPGAQDIWIYDLMRGTTSRVTFGSGDDNRALWTLDGEHIVFWRSEERGLFQRAANGTGQPRRLTSSPAIPQAPLGFDPNGNQLIIQQNVNLLADIGVLSLDSEEDLRPLLATEFFEGAAALSPDGRWIAYISDETGTGQLFVRSFPDVDGGKWQISRDGASDPRWGPDGKELFFRDGLALMVVSVEGEDALSADNPQILFTGPYWNENISTPNYDISPDGHRFLMMKSTALSQEDSEAGQTTIVAVENWFDELERLAPPGR